jgi:hypothetical protein
VAAWIVFTKGIFSNRKKTKDLSKKSHLFRVNMGFCFISVAWVVIDHVTSDRPIEKCSSISVTFTGNTLLISQRNDVDI